MREADQRPINPTTQNATTSITAAIVIEASASTSSLRHTAATTSCLPSVVRYDSSLTIVPLSRSARANALACSSAASLVRMSGCRRRASTSSK